MSATVTGKNEVVGIKISEEVVDPDDIEMLQDLIAAAVNEALRAAEKDAAEVMEKYASQGSDSSLGSLGSSLGALGLGRPGGLPF